MSTSELLVPAAVAFAVAGLLHLCFAYEEIYLNWLVAVLLLAPPVAYWALAGAPNGIGALGGLAAGAAVFGLRSWQLHRDHQTRLESFAHELGLRFSRDDQTYESLAMRFADEPGRCFDVLSGTWRGTPVAVFRYRYTDTSDEPAVMEITCAAAMIDRELPRMLVEPRRFKPTFRRRTDEVGHDDFDRRYQVLASDAERAKASLPQRTREWLLAHAKNGKLAVDGTTILLTTGRSRLKHLPAVLDRIVDLRATFR
jgi:hypothetical protein